MTLETMLRLAGECTKCYTSTHAPGHQLARAVTDLLAESAPCGFEAPRVLDSGLVCIPESWRGPSDTADIRAMARMMLQAADSAEAKGDSK